MKDNNPTPKLALTRNRLENFVIPNLNAQDAYNMTLTNKENRKNTSKLNLRMLSYIDNPTGDHFNKVIDDKKYYDGTTNADIRNRFENAAIKNDLKNVIKIFEKISSLGLTVPEQKKQEDALLKDYLKDHLFRFIATNDIPDLLQNYVINNIDLKEILDLLEQNKSKGLIEDIKGFKYTNDPENLTAFIKIINNTTFKKATTEQSTYLKQQLQKALTYNAVKQNGWPLKYASDALKNDKEVVLAAVKQNGRALGYASNALKEDKDVVLEAVKQNGRALGYAHYDLKNDRGVVLAAVTQSGRALGYAHYDLKKDRGFVLAAVTQSGRALKYAHYDLKNDKAVVLAAVKQNGSALEYASNKLKNNKDVVLAAVKQNSSALRDASDELKNDKEFVLAAVKQNGLALQFVSDDLRGEPLVILEAMKQNENALDFIPVHEDKNIYLLLAKIDKLGEDEKIELNEEEKATLENPKFTEIANEIDYERDGVIKYGSGYGQLHNKISDLRKPSPSCFDAIFKCLSKKSTNETDHNL